MFGSKVKETKEEPDFVAIQFGEVVKSLDKLDLKRRGDKIIVDNIPYDPEQIQFLDKAGLVAFCWGRKAKPNNFMVGLIEPSKVILEGSIPYKKENQLIAN